MQLPEIDSAQAPRFYSGDSVWVMHHDEPAVTPVLSYVFTLVHDETGIAPALVFVRYRLGLVNSRAPDLNFHPDEVFGSEAEVRGEQRCENRPPAFTWLPDLAENNSPQLRTGDTVWIVLGREVRRTAVAASVIQCFVSRNDCDRRSVFFTGYLLVGHEDPTMRDGSFCAEDLYGSEAEASAMAAWYPVTLSDEEWVGLLGRSDDCDEEDDDNQFSDDYGEVGNGDNEIRDLRVILRQARQAGGLIARDRDKVVPYLGLTWNYGPYPVHPERPLVVLPRLLAQLGLEPPTGAVLEDEE